jgi:undecaprenyl-phosphate 4-deoxy-4-formamido-L-arabinose transferase
MLPAGISVVVPVYRSARILPKLVERLAPVLAAEARAFELVLLDDNSPDDSWRVIGELARAHPWVRGMRMMRNFGQHGALLCGIRQARYDVVVTMDDDLQHPPEELPKLLRELERGADVVYGSPAEERHGFLRDLASRITKMALAHAMGAATARRVSAFRVLRTQLREAFTGYSGQFVSIDVLLTWGTTRFASVEVRHDPRAEGLSGYTVGKLLTHALNMLTGYSAKPLQVASLTGFAFTLFGMGVLAYVMVSYAIKGGSVPGFPFLASVIAIFSGAQLFALGIMGEYLARIHFRTMSRPTYAVRETTDERGPPTLPPTTPSHP